jgi:hypothetical protein
LPCKGYKPILLVFAHASGGRSAEKPDGLDFLGKTLILNPWLDPAHFSRHP